MHCAWLLNPYSCKKQLWSYTSGHDIKKQLVISCTALMFTHLHLQFPKTFHYKQLILTDWFIKLEWPELTLHILKKLVKSSTANVIGESIHKQERIFPMHAPNIHIKSVVLTYFSDLNSRREEVWLALATGTRGLRH